MDQEQKIAFTRRLSQCNKGEMVVIIYDIYFAHSEYAKMQFEAGDRDGFKESVRRAADVVSELIRALDMSYDIAYNLRPIYQYCKTQVYQTLAENKLDGLKEADFLLGKLRSAFIEAAKSDTSDSIMQNSQNVYAGMTYGKGSLVENYDFSANRGYSV